MEIKLLKRKKDKNKVGIKLAPPTPTKKVGTMVRQEGFTVRGTHDKSGKFIFGIVATTDPKDPTVPLSILFHKKDVPSDFEYKAFQPVNFLVNRERGKYVAMDVTYEDNTSVWENIVDTMVSKKAKQIDLIWALAQMYTDSRSQVFGDLSEKEMSEKILGKWLGNHKNIKSYHDGKIYI